MARNETVTLTNMCMIENEEGKFLVQDRVDPVWGGIVFPGGHVEAEESFAQSVIREVQEETGLVIKEPKLCGVKQFRDYDGRRYIVFLYKANMFSGTLQASREGNVMWLSLEEIKSRRMAPGFEDLLKIFLDDTISELCYEGIWSQDGADEARFF